MSRHRIEPPLGLRSSPNLVVCTKRKAELLEEFLKRLDYVLASFRLGLATVDFNESLTHLKRTVRMGPQKPGRGDRLHPILEILVNQKAWKFARERTIGDEPRLKQDDVEKAAAWVADNITARRGRPRAQLLDHHVAGLMALIQQFTGRPVLESRKSGTDFYDPKLLGAARILLHLREIDSSITETQLVNKVRDVRRRYAGKPMRFRDSYPLYGATLSAAGEPVLAPPLRLEHFERSVPIYCP